MQLWSLHWTNVQQAFDGFAAVILGFLTVMPQAVTQRDSCQYSFTLTSA